MNAANLNSFLQLGYFLDYHHPNIEIDTSGIDKEKYRDAGEEDLIAVGCRVLREAISANHSGDEDIVVPISGGLDSRAILAGLLEHRSAACIHTYTFGTPGTWDFDIGCEVAKGIGTQHRAFDLTKISYCQDELEDISTRIDQQAVLFHHWPVWQVDQEFGGATNWSGFLGEALTGDHLHRNPAIDETQGKDNFVERNTYVKSVKLHSMSPIHNLLQTDDSAVEQLTVEENLDLQNRQTKFIAPIVLMKGYTHKTPFLHQPWVDFTLSVDNDKHRRHQRLYKLILQRAFPEPFSWRTKTNRGFPLNASPLRRVGYKISAKMRRILRQPSLSTNYVDFNEQIRRRADLQEIMRSNLGALDGRKLLERVTASQILKDHLSRRVDCADALIVLTSLEIHLKTGKTI